MLLGSEKLFSLALRSFPCTIGRSRRCDLVLPLPEVSRVHAIVERRASGIVVQDRSRNGITWNCERTRTATIRPGDVVRVAAYRLLFEDDPSGVRSSEGTAETAIGHRIGRSDPGAPAGLGEMLGVSHPMREVYAMTRRLASMRQPVLILGETGTGKELVAHALHSLGTSPDGPWVAVNCAAIAAELVESELFGHERGAFTGATRPREGAFVAAAGGTLFLDEIGEMPLALQPKLLRVLENAEVSRVGGSRPIPVTARVIAATNRDLAGDADSGRFRRDLYYRLCVLPVTLPALRDRGDDIGLLAGHFAAEDRAGVTFTGEALDYLRTYSWPGNVRELRNLVRRLGVRGLGRPATVEDAREALEADRRHTVSPPVSKPPSVDRERGSREDARGGTSSLSGRTLRDVERLVILRALQDCDGNKQAAARRLGIAPATLYEKIKRYGLLVPRRQA